MNSEEPAESDESSKKIKTLLKTEKITEIFFCAFEISFNALIKN